MEKSKLIGDCPSGEYELTGVSAEQKVKNAKDKEALIKQLRQKVAFHESPHDHFNNLIGDGTINRVVDARLKGQDLSLVKVLYPNRKEPEPAAVKQNSP